MGAADPHSAPPSEGSSNEFFYAAALPSRQASVQEAGLAPGRELPLAIPVAAATAAADEAEATLVWSQPIAVADPEAAEAPSASAAAQEWAWPAGNFGSLTDSAMWPRLEVQPALPAVQEAQAEEHPEVVTPPAPAQAQQPAAEEGEQWSLSGCCVAFLLAQAKQAAADEGEQLPFL